MSVSNLLIERFDKDGDRFLTIAHRGASHYFPENTMAAFKGAIEMEADMLELDVLLSKDGKIMVIHDATLDRTTDGEGPVKEKTLKELKKLDAGNWFGSKFRGEPIPTLREALTLAQNKIHVNIEIKTEAVTDSIEGGIEEIALNLVEELGMKNQVIFSSFDYRAIKHLRALDKEIAVAILYNGSETENGMPSELVKKFETDAFNCGYKQLSETWIKNIHKHNIPVLVYTVNTRSRMKKIIKKGVTGIFSNKPDVLKQTVRKIRQ